MNQYCDFITPLYQPADIYGEVPFYWWTGGRLDKERLTEQLTELKKNGVAGVQINYAHQFQNEGSDLPYGGAGRSIPGDPEQFSEAWWEMFTYAAEECERLGMGIGLGDYTLAWIGNGFFTDRVANTEGMQGYELSCERKMLYAPDELEITPDLLCVVTFEDGDYAKPQVLYSYGEKENSVPFGCSECFVVKAERVERSINPMAKNCGKMLTDIYFKEFERRLPNLKKGTLNYFFQDELLFNCNIKRLWHPDLAKEVQKQYGYDLLGFLPHLFYVLSPLSAKIRLNVADVKTRLMEERYFMPVYEFHASRGMLYGCDQSSRGREPDEFSDYFQTVRWFTAPGNDTPGRDGDLIKVKVNASIAHLYNRPRTWLEAYHSSGWGTTLDSITSPTDDNFIYGANLLNLHGLYYTTNGGFFEWAPPDFHFRMPYWEHEKYWLDKYKRMSAMLTTGVHRCDAAIFYPVSSCDYGENAETAVNSAFETAETLFAAGVDFDFIDRQSIENAVIDNGELCVAGERYKVIILCHLDAVRYTVLKKLKVFAEKGGTVIFKDITPYISDKNGENDPDLMQDITAMLTLTNVGLVNGDAKVLNFVNRHITRSFLPDLTSQKGKVYVTRRLLGNDSLFYVRYAQKDTVCRFEATSAPYLIDPYRQKVYALTGTVQRAQFTFIKLPLEANEDTLILFTDAPVETDGEINTVGFEEQTLRQCIVLNGDWDFTLKPTLNNKYGDFFMPPSGVIGAEARFFDVAFVDDCDTLPDTYRYRGIPYNTNFSLLKIETDAPERLCKKYSAVGVPLPENACEVKTDTRYGYVSYGFDGDWDAQKLEQGYHGLKGRIFNDNMIFDKSAVFFAEIQGNGETAYLSLCGVVPDCLYINGKKAEASAAPIHLQKGKNRLAVGFVYDEKKGGELRNDGKIKHAGVYLTKAKNVEPCHIPLAKADFLNDGYYHYLPSEKTAPVTCLHFESVPGFRGVEGEIRGTLLKAVSDGESMAISQNGVGVFGQKQYKALCRTASPAPTQVYLYIRPENGSEYTDCIVRPLSLLSETGRVKTGDWQKLGALKNYSGQAVYKTVFSLDRLAIDEKAVLDLGKVGATAEVKLNGKHIHTFTYAPFTCDITAYLNNGENTLEITVANTLCNHYATIPSRYSNYPQDAASGLIGEVTIRVTTDKSF